MRDVFAHAQHVQLIKHCTLPLKEARAKSKIREGVVMSTSTKRDQKKELPIYDPEGLDPEVNQTFEEVKVPLQETITSTRLAVQHTLASVEEAVVRVREDTRKSLTSVAGKTRKQTNATLSSLGLGESTQVLRGSAYAGAALTGLVLARRRSLFVKMVYPLLGVGLVGGVFHRHDLYTRYKNAFEGGGFQGNWSSWKPWKGGDWGTKWRKSEGEDGGKEK